MKKTAKNYSLASICNQEIAQVCELDIEEYEKYAADIISLELFDREERLYRLVELNHGDLLNKITAYSEAYTEDPRMNMHRLTEISLDLNRLILNLLSSIRTYLDHTETRLKKTKQPELELFKKLTAEAFDQYFAYRFLAKLRNYAQHCGLPAGAISARSEKKRHKLSLNLDSQMLLKDFDSWGAIVKADLHQCPEEFDILPLLNEKVNLLALINEQLSTALLTKLQPAGQRLLALLKKAVESKPGHPVLLQTQGSQNRSKLQIRWLPLNMISRTTGIEIVFE